MGYRAILTSLVSYKSPDNVPDTFTPDVMQTLIRLHSALPFHWAFHGHDRDYPFSTSLSPNEASVGISIYSAPFTLTLVTRWLPFSLSFTTAPVSGCRSIRWFAGCSWKPPAEGHSLGLVDIASQSTALDLRSIIQLSQKSSIFCTTFSKNFRSSWFKAHTVRAWQDL